LGSLQTWCLSIQRERGSRVNLSLLGLSV
jgi:hypothetical protein